MPQHPAPPVEVVDTIHGHHIADPYRWLEDFGSDETQSWLAEQSERWAVYLAQPAVAARRADFRRALDRVVPGVVSTPSFRGERAFFTRRLPGMDHAQLIVRDGDDPATERVLVDPAELSDDGTITLEGSVASDDGGRVALLLGEAGREEVILRVLDTSTGATVGDDVLLGRGGDAEWLPGGEELVVVKVAPGTPDEERQFHRRVYRHRVGADPAGDVLLFGEGRDKTTYFGIHVDHSGRWLLVSCHLGTAPRNDLYLHDLRAPEAGFRTVLEGEDAQATGSVHDGRLVLWTDRGAPRGRLVIAPLDAPDPTGWRDLVAERDDAVLNGWVRTEHHLVLTWEQHALSAVTVHDPATGERQRDLELPGLGTVGVVARRDRQGDDVWLGYTDDIAPYHVLHHDLASGATDTWADAPGATSVEGIDSELVFVTSLDGTEVPVRVLSPSGAPRDGSGAALLTGYGGFQISMAPAYSSMARLWVEAGGVFATACMRGGGEYGQEWHRAGMRANKHRVYEDFEAAADWLVSSGHSAPDRLAIIGGSNGGLLMGAALTRRPGAYRAVVCINGLLDMVRYELFGLGVTWNDEYGTVERADELEWLLGYSPYHHVRDAVAYPAVLVIASDEDTRVDPMHSRKMVAALQAATSASVEERPVLLRREGKVGHGVRAVSRTLDEVADRLAFLADQLGLDSAALRSGLRTQEPSA